MLINAIVISPLPPSPFVKVGLNALFATTEGFGKRWHTQHDTMMTGYIAYLSLLDMMERSIGRVTAGCHVYMNIMTVLYCGSIICFHLKPG